jgi:hypothetical protein
MVVLWAFIKMRVPHGPDVLHGQVRKLRDLRRDGYRF